MKALSSYRKSGKYSYGRSEALRAVILILSVVVLIMIMTGCAGKPGTETGTDGTSADDEPESAEVFAMDTYMTLTAYGDGAKEALSESVKEIRRIDALLSTGKDDSEISRLNSEKKAEVSPETFELIQRAVEIGRETDGIFDISIYPVMQEWGFTDKNYKVPGDRELKAALERVDYSGIRLDETEHTVELKEDMAIDLGGIAKGYTSDRVVGILMEHGIEHALINLGGNVKVLGDKPDGSAWKVAVIDPEDQEKYIGGVAVTDKAVITSGGYQRFFEEDGEKYFHIIDVKDGYPARNGLISATVITSDGTLGDALSTSLFIMGPEKACDYWKKHAEDFDFVLVKDNGSVLVSEGIADSYFTEKEFEIVSK